MEDKRALARLVAPIKARYKVEGTPGEQEESRALDISTGGLRLCTTDKLTIDTPLELELNIPPNYGSFFAKGKVVWIREVSDKVEERHFEVGIRFTKVSTIKPD